MFEKKVFLYNDFLAVGRKRIPWDQIVGIREYNYVLLQKISNRFPRVELYLKSGKVVTILKLYKFEDYISSQKDDEKNDFQSIIATIKKSSINQNPIFTNWLGWRLILPLAILEFIAFIVFILMSTPFEKAMSQMIYAIIPGVVIGFWWERKARKKYLHKK